MPKLKTSRLRIILIALGVAIIVWGLWMPFYKVTSVNDDGMDVAPLVAIEAGILLLFIVAVAPLALKDIRYFREKRKKR